MPSCSRTFKCKQKVTVLFDTLAQLAKTFVAKVVRRIAEIEKPFHLGCGKLRVILPIYWFCVIAKHIKPNKCTILTI